MFVVLINVQKVWNNKSTVYLRTPVWGRRYLKSWIRNNKTFRGLIKEYLIFISWCNNQMVKVRRESFLFFFQNCFVGIKKMCSFALPLRDMRGDKKRRSSLKILKISQSTTWEGYFIIFFWDNSCKQFLYYLQRRVWSWLRMNASGRLNTCKSNGNRKSLLFADEWRTGA